VPISSGGAICRRLHIAARDVPSINDEEDHASTELLRRAIRRPVASTKEVATDAMVYLLPHILPLA
jgi:hypothetical protein